MKYSLYLLLASCFVLNMARAESLTKTKFNNKRTITCEGLYDDSLQGFTTDKKSIWWSFGDRIVKTNMDGKVSLDIKLQNVSIRGILVNGTKVYVLLLRKNKTAGVNIYKTENMALIKSFTLTGFKASTPRSITFADKHFFVLGDAQKSSKILPVNEYSMSFKLIKTHKVNTYHEASNFKNIAFIDNCFYIARVSGRRNKYSLFKFNKQFKNTGKYDSYCCIGSVEIAPKLCLVGRTILKKYVKRPRKISKWIGLLRTAKVNKSGIDVIGKRGLRATTYRKMPSDYFQTRKQYSIPRNRNPYKGINWKIYKQVLNSSHMHCRIQRTLDRILDRGVKFLTLSNYYPAMPVYPIKNNRLKEDFSAVTDGLARNGKKVSKKRNLIKMICDPKTGWQGEIEPAAQVRLLGNNIRTYKLKINKDVIEAPNAEHYGFKSVSIHITSPGSTFSSGHFDGKDKYRLRQHGFLIGVGMPWPMVFDQIFAKLMFKDAGGVIINHPKRSHTKFKNILAFLDFDSRVLGMEIYNSGYSWNEELWDKVLATGRQCYGFFVPDHGAQSKNDWVGLNILLVPKVTANECLKALRNGQLYGAILGKGIKFTSIKSNNISIKVKTGKAQKIEFITEKGIVKTVLSNKGEYTFPRKKNEKPDLVFVRVRAFEFADNKDYDKSVKRGGYLGNGEVIFSQPVMYKSKKEVEAQEHRSQ